MDLTEIKQSSERIYEGHIINLDRDVVSLPDGNITYREIVHHPGGACVCALDDQMNVYLVRQFRYAYHDETLELPAGKIDEGEEASTTAMRELEEEAGLVADQLVFLGEIQPSPGYTDELIYMYLAIGVSQTQQNLDVGEFIQIEKVPFTEALTMVIQNKIKDAKTQICLLKAYFILNSLEEQEEG